MAMYEKGRQFGEHRFKFPYLKKKWPFFLVILATQKNISGTYTKEIRFPGFCFIRGYKGVYLEILGLRILS